MRPSPRPSHSSLTEEKRASRDGAATSPSSVTISKPDAARIQTVVVGDSPEFMVVSQSPTQIQARWITPTEEHFLSTTIRVPIHQGGLSRGRRSSLAFDAKISVRLDAACITVSDGAMPAAIPLIRGFALLPTLHWLADAGVSIERTLAEVDLSLSPITHPFRPIPLAHAAALLRNAAREHGPDLPCRIVSKTSSLEIAMLGKVALGARTPGEALARIVAALPYYCSHEQVSFERKPGQYVVREFFAHRFDPETQHTLLQYAAAMIDRVLSMAGSPPPRFAKIEIPPHPKHQVEHLRCWFSYRVIETKSRGRTVLIEDRVM